MDDILVFGVARSAVETTRDSVPDQTADGQPRKRQRGARGWTAEQRRSRGDSLTLRRVQSWYKKSAEEQAETLNKFASSTSRLGRGDLVVKRSGAKRSSLRTSSERKKRFSKAICSLSIVVKSDAKGRTKCLSTSCRQRDPDL